MKKIKCNFIVLILFLGILPAMLLSEEIYEVHRISQPITLDGRIDEPVWDEIEPVPLVSHWPQFGEVPSEPTEIRICFDETFLYLAAKCYDDPDGIQGPTFTRDKWDMTMDAIALILDTFNDNESGLIFVVTPRGSRIDATIDNDAQPTPAGNSVSLDWSTFWDVAIQENDIGWFAEMRIPFSSLRFQDRDGIAQMGLIAYRYIARKVELSTFPGIQPKWGFWSFVKPSQAQKIQLSGVQKTNPLYITPYMLGGLGQNSTLDPTQQFYSTMQNKMSDMGFDLKYGLTNNFTLDVTYNTDFAQVEADDQQVNLTRYSLFFPEKRQFFLERASLFDFNFGEPDRLFYSRQIGLHKNQSIPILGGAKIVGRTGEWDVGLLDIHTKNQVGLSAENFGILRLKRKIFNPYSYLGIISTSRTNQSGRYNIAYGVDGIIRIFRDDYITVKWAQSFDRDYKLTFSNLNSARIQALWERRTFKDFGYRLRFDRAGAFYNPGIGFELRENYTRVGGRLSYGWFVNTNANLQQWQIAFDGQVYTRNVDQTVESAQAGPMFLFEWKRGNKLEIFANWNYEHVMIPFPLSDEVRVEAGEYDFYGINLTYDTPRSRFLTTELTLQTGTFYDGYQVSGGMQPAWVVSPHLTLEGAYQVDFIDFVIRNTQFLAHLARLRIEMAMNTKYSASTYIQYNSTADAIITNFRFRYNPKEGNDFYLVYTEGMNIDRHRIFPTLPVTDNRTILFKYTYTFLL